MNDLDPPRDLISRFSDAIQLPGPRGWAAPAVRWLAVWFLGNLGWIVGGVITWVQVPEPVFLPPPGWSYWSLWCGGGAVAIIGLALAVARLPITERQGWIWFGLLSLMMCLFEEALCYWMGTGMWEHRSRFFPEFLVGVAVLAGWSAGSALVLRLSGLEVWDALILCGFSGWLAEGFIIPRFIHAPLLMTWIIPLSIVSYVLLILPGVAAVARHLPRLSADRRGRIRSHVAAILLPVGCWLATAIVTGFFVKI